MNTLNQLLRAVITNPDADTVRLAYADALDERSKVNGKWSDSHYAEFIRSEITRALDGHAACINEDREYFRGTFMSLPEGYSGWSSRGFYEQVRCTAESFLRHADELIWHPTQTVECQECGGHGTYMQAAPDRGPAPSCTRCDRTGRVPRPCPDTAQPIRRVVLTTPITDTPNMNDFALIYQREEDGVCRWRSERWPDVEFVLPTGYPDPNATYIPDWDATPVTPVGT